MKNVIMILMDSVISDCLGTGRTQVSSTPFIDELIANGVYINNVFSNGPYTDAATKALYTGEPTLDNYGYYYQLNNAKNNIYKLFHDSGYETYGFYYPYYLISGKIKKNIDHSIYLSGMIYSSTWNGKLSYYAEIIKKRTLYETEYRLIKKVLELQFDSWSNYYSDLLENDESSQLIKNNYNYDTLCESISKLKYEKEKFEQSYHSYIDEVLRMGMGHPLAKIDCVNTDTLIEKAFIREIYTKHRDVFDRAKKFNKKYNIKNNNIPIRKALRCIRKSMFRKSISEMRCIINYLRCLYSIEEMEKISQNDRWQLIVSARRQTNALLTMLDNYDNDKPFFASLHFLEAHNSISCFTYDTHDMKMIDEEIKVISKTIEGCGSDFKGNLLYQMSLTYIDFCIKELVNSIKEKDMIEDTTIILVADHGSSYSYYPIRNHIVNTFHEENYITPFIMWNCNDIKCLDKENLWSSVDILPTILASIGIEIPAGMAGRNILEKDAVGRDYIITEYMGPGCPDMLSREIWLSVRNAKYVVGVRHPIDREYSSSSICVIYNLIKDRAETVNVAKTEKLNGELVQIDGIIAKRISEIQANTKISIKRIMEDK